MAGRREQNVSGAESLVGGRNFAMLNRRQKTFRMKTFSCLPRASVVLISACCAGISARANDWPQWRGPQRNGISQETGLLAEWPKDGPKLVWKRTDIGSGYSTPAVVGGRIYVL